MFNKPKILSYLGVLLIIALLVEGTLTGSVSAAQITTRALTLQAGTSDGGSAPGGVVNHLFTFTLPTAGTVGSVLFQYCTLAAGACVTPTGLDTTAATLGTTSGISFNSVVATTNGSPYASLTVPISMGANTGVTVQLLSVTNPTAANQTFYVRISDYASSDTTGSPIDTGNVAASTANPIILTGTMPESLVFCTGATIGTTGGVPDCSTATSGSIAFNQLFSPTDTATAVSQMAASTNAGAGYNITVNGPTLTSGSNTVTAMNAPATGVRGTSQFGLNLKANTTATSSPAIGTEVAPAANGTNYRGQALGGYNTSDTFKFTTTDSVANSSNGGAGGSDAQIFTVSYIVNVPGSQPAGTYTTTLTYICTPSF